MLLVSVRTPDWLLKFCLSSLFTVVAFIGMTFLSVNHHYIQTYVQAFLACSHLPTKKQWTSFDFISDHCQVLQINFERHPDRVVDNILKFKASSKLAAGARLVRLQVIRFDFHTLSSLGPKKMIVSMSHVRGKGT